MKTSLLSLLILSMSLGAFAQGKVQLANNGATAICMPDGQGVPTTGPLVNGAFLVVGLYAGTSSTSLALYTTVMLNPLAGTGQAPGVITPTRCTLPWGGVLTYMAVGVWDNAYPTWGAAWKAGRYVASTTTFTMTPGTSIAYPNTFNGGGTTYQQVPLPLGFIGTDLSNIPEPSPSGFAGAATLLLAIRRLVIGRRDPGKGASI